ncbi:hypothetical protein AKO1_012270 [Acrasis kona]|uniref:Uncharacterized protein n=1 Tax=Acrasis kona TaxID=1008807 RepID=A0AAW2Z9T8_9EUKA
MVSIKELVSDARHLGGTEGAHLDNKALLEIREVLRLLNVKVNQPEQNDEIMNTLIMFAGHLDKILVKVEKVEALQKNSKHPLDGKVDSIMNLLQDINSNTAGDGGQAHNNDASSQLRKQLADKDRELIEMREEIRQLRISAHSKTQTLPEQDRRVETEQFNWRINILKSINKFFENPIEKQSLKVIVVFSSDDNTQLQDALMDLIQNLPTYGVKNQNNSNSVKIEYHKCVIGDDIEQFQQPTEQKTHLYIYVALPNSARNSHIQSLRTHLKHGNNFVVLVVDVNGKRAKVDDHILSWVHIGSEYERQGFVHEVYVQNNQITESSTNRLSICSLQNTLYDVLMLRHLYTFAFGRKPLMIGASSSASTNAEEGPKHQSIPLPVPPVKKSTPASLTRNLSTDKDLNAMDQDASSSATNTNASSATANTSSTTSHKNIETGKPLPAPPKTAPPKKNVSPPIIVNPNNVVVSVVHHRQPSAANVKIESKAVEKEEEEEEEEQVKQQPAEEEKETVEVERIEEKATRERPQPPVRTNRRLVRKYMDDMSEITDITDSDEEDDTCSSISEFGPHVEIKSNKTSPARPPVNKTHVLKIITDKRKVV